MSILFRIVVTAMGAMLIAVALPATRAEAAQLPAGSYQQSCQVYSVDDVMMTATCKSKAGKTKLNRNFKYIYCLGDISNQDGFLSCAKDQAKIAADQANAAAAAAAAKAEADKKKAQDDAVAAAEAKFNEQEAAKPAFASAANVFLGRNPLAQEVPQWLTLMNAPEYGMAAQAADGVSYVEAAAFLKAHLTKPGSAKLRAEAIDNAFLEIYGRPSTSLEQAKWDAQVKVGKAWYVPIVGQERAAMMASPTARMATINAAYFASFGRDGSAAEVAYYQPRTEHFRQIVALNRNWLYSSSGAPELILTIARAQIAKGQTPDDATIKADLPGYTAKRATYAEMLKPAGVIKIGK